MARTIPEFVTLEQVIEDLKKPEKGLYVSGPAIEVYGGTGHYAGKFPVDDYCLLMYQGEATLVVAPKNPLDIEDVAAQNELIVGMTGLPYVNMYPSSIGPDSSIKDDNFLYIGGLEFLENVSSDEITLKSVKTRANTMLAQQISRKSHGINMQTQTIYDVARIRARVLPTERAARAYAERLHERDFEKRHEIFPLVVGSGLNTEHISVRDLRARFV